jgi:hypothetical protein
MLPTPPPAAEPRPAHWLTIYAYHLLALVLWLGNLGYTAATSRPNLLVQFGLLAAGYYAQKLRPSGKLPRPVSNWEKAFRVSYLLVFLANLAVVGLQAAVLLFVLTHAKPYGSH